jgi:hypothetical protein
MGDGDLPLSEARTGKRVTVVYTYLPSGVLTNFNTSDSNQHTDSERKRKATSTLSAPIDLEERKRQPALTKVELLQCGSRNPSQHP